MGLDVYLVEKEKELRDNEREAQWEALFQRKEAGEISEAEYGEQTDGLLKWEPNPEVPSKKHGEDTLFNRRYLRSSYNDGGFNRAVPEYIGEDRDLYWVFDPIIEGGEQYSYRLDGDLIPALEEARQRALYLAEKLHEVEHPLRVETLSADPMCGDADHLWNSPPTSDDALQWYRDETARMAESEHGFHMWSNAKGYYFGGPDQEDAGMTILAAVAGKDVLGRPAVHVVCASSKENVEHYAVSAEITAEFCEEAISLVKRDGEVYIHWSS